MLFLSELSDSAIDRKNYKKIKLIIKIIVSRSPHLVLCMLPRTIKMSR